MAFDLLSGSSDPPFSTERQHIAIAEVVIYSLIHLVQFSTRYMQEQRYWHHNENKGVGRCTFYSWCSMIGLLSQIRIADAALVLATSHPNKSQLIADSALRSVGLSPLLFEVSLVMLRWYDKRVPYIRRIICAMGRTNADTIPPSSGQSGEIGPGNSKWTQRTRFALHSFRFPVFIAIIMAVVGGCIDIPALGIAGCSVLLVTFVYVCCLVGWLAVTSREILPASVHRAVLITLSTLPFFLVRIIYLLLGKYGSAKFNPTTGDISTFIGMGSLMEILIVILLLTARGTAEPVRLFGDFGPTAYNDLESPED
ncbi:uncharacterized protein N7515_000060 [Penicillium bovifimosum]|uniref:DUF7702 domain-containing protein n=1 Tax=Penicillium bovifimosum TaxID=126998 RepID=A0A9W9LB39_9EURO|nr:uncharacterized protein N7515_000060 [Penicillium bovifimosum]KAJ5145496.1 hypothetical protein N7515_000060 [Penicillium bovifimosum]